MNVVLCGATGLVGQEILSVLEKRNFPIDTLIPVASEKSIGKKITFKDKQYVICSVEDALNSSADIALFSAGGDFSKKYAQDFAKKGIRVIDNSSAWRMDEQVKLIVPEVNGHDLVDSDMIISNPNCSTIQLVMILKPLHEKYGIERVIVSTYQSITGTGKAAVDQMESERAGKDSLKAYPHQIDQNCLPHCDVFLDNDYTKEEMKLVNESRKILGINNLKLTATAVRVPVIRGHSESVNIQLKNSFDLTDLKSILEGADGVVVYDDPAKNKYPMPIHAQGKDEVFVGRIRKDNSIENGLNLWIVADNLRKGAATNAVQIAELLNK